jgi:hypothetical protein
MYLRGFIVEASAVRKLQGRQEYPLLEDCNRATTS